MPTEPEVPNQIEAIPGRLVSEVFCFVMGQRIELNFIRDTIRGKMLNVVQTPDSRLVHAESMTGIASSGSGR